MNIRISLLFTCVITLSLFASPQELLIDFENEKSSRQLSSNCPDSAIGWKNTDVQTTKFRPEISYIGPSGLDYTLMMKWINETGDLWATDGNDSWILYENIQSINETYGYGYGSNDESYLEEASPTVIGIIDSDVIFTMNSYSIVDTGNNNLASTVNYSVELWITDGSEDGTRKFYSWDSFGDSQLFSKGNTIDGISVSSTVADTSNCYTRYYGWNTCKNKGIEHNGNLYFSYYHGTYDSVNQTHEESSIIVSTDGTWNGTNYVNTTLVTSELLQAYQQPNGGMRNMIIANNTVYYQLERGGGVNDYDHRFHLDQNLTPTYQDTWFSQYSAFKRAEIFVTDEYNPQSSYYVITRIGGNGGQIEKMAYGDSINNSNFGDWFPYLYGINNNNVPSHSQASLVDVAKHQGDLYLLTLGMEGNGVTKIWRVGYGNQFFEERTDTQSRQSMGYRELVYTLPFSMQSGHIMTDPFTGQLTVLDTSASTPGNYRYYRFNETGIAEYERLPYIWNIPSNPFWNSPGSPYAIDLNGWSIRADSPYGIADLMEPYTSPLYFGVLAVLSDNVIVGGMSDYHYNSGNSSYLFDRQIQIYTLGYWDDDGDGICNGIDWDSDGDGFPEAWYDEHGNWYSQWERDVFPYNPSEWWDTDEDGVGNNADEDDDNDGHVDSLDAFPYDNNEHSDNDGDGVGDNHDQDDDNDGWNDWIEIHDCLTDPLLNDSTNQSHVPVDFDGDGTCDLVDLDDDGDSYNDTIDLFPFDSSEWVDFDLDGIGDNSDDDLDGDGWNNSEDDFPLDNTEWLDTDDDGVGNNADGDDDNDRIEDIDDFCPVGETGWISGATLGTDLDGDGCRDEGEDVDDDNDGINDTNDTCPRGYTGWISNPLNDLDADGCHVIEDFDIDGDGFSNLEDLFPEDPAEWDDSDGDGVGDNADVFPSDASETADSDGDGVGDNSDWAPNDPTEAADSDGDGVGDNADVFPSDASETADSDGDGVGDNADWAPNDPTEAADSDGDGVGDNADLLPDLKLYHSYSQIFMQLILITSLFIIAIRVKRSPKTK